MTENQQHLGLTFRKTNSFVNLLDQRLAKKKRISTELNQRTDQLNQQNINDFTGGQASNIRVVSGTCTSAFQKKKLEERGLNMYLFDANEPELGVVNALKHSTHLLVSIPPVVGIGDPMLQHDEFLKSRIRDGDLQWLCYLSSTSVYGDCGGKLVDEDYPTSPASESTKLRLAAEKGWLNLGSELGLSTQVFRNGGIYGPGRSAVDTIINQGSLSESQRMRITRQYTSRVHVADICQALKASIQMPSLGL